MYWVFHLIAMLVASGLIYGALKQCNMTMREFTEEVLDDGDFESLDSGSRQWIINNMDTVLQILLVVMPWIPLGIVIYAIINYK
jgi:hypothetical protein